MKKVLIISILALILIVGCIFSYLAINSDSILASFKPQLEKLASEKLESKVALGKLSLSVFPETSIKIDKLTMTQPGSEKLSLNNITLDVSLLPLLSKKLQINEFKLDKPIIKIISTGQETYIAGLKPSKKNKASKATKNELVEADSTSDLPLDLNLKSFSINDATLELIDKTQGKVKQITNINLDSSLDISPVNNSAKLHSDANFKIQNETLRSEFDLTTSSKLIDIPVIELDGFGGKINGKATIGLKGVKAVTANVNALELNAAKAFDSLNPEKAGMIEGILNTFNLNLEGSAKNQLTESLTGKAEINFTKGSIKGFNLVKEVLKGLAELPFFRDRLMSAVPEEHKAEIISENTAIESLTANFTIANQALSTNNLNILSTIFSLKGQGFISFKGAIKLDAQLVFNKAFSTGIADKIKEAKYLLNENGEILVPLSLHGIAPDLRVLPDLKTLAKMGLTQGIADKASKLLGDEGKVKLKGLDKLLGF
ncbi:MAG: AsmA family protein [Bdellovibrionota bacterium]